MINSYNTFWLVFVGQKISKKISKVIFKNYIFTTHQNGFIKLVGNAKLLQEETERIVSILKNYNIEGRLFAVTDKQFGYSQLVFDGGILHTTKPFNYYVNMKDKYSSIYIPLTRKQIDATIII